VTGVPVRAEFFKIPTKPPGEELTVLITGGSRGSRTLNQAFSASWPLFKKEGVRVRFLHQSGVDAHAELTRRFSESGLPGSVEPFIADMPAAFAEADLIVCRSGANAIAELAAAGKPAILVPFPFAADDHQKKNAEALVRAGAARLVEDRDMNGERLFAEVIELARHREMLTRMGEAARTLAHPGAAVRAASVLEELI
jgi:UDP-N-acetylglucosamine--N-acetylmuramyl-(pentapeptide) pyrophosphoryl-undecaprenol N-acetylglucosamine transferase